MTYNTASEIERYMVELINAERAAVGLHALQIEQNLNESAEKHSEWMLEADIFSHTGKNNSKHEERIEAAGFDMSGYWRTGENIALQSIDNDGSFRDEVEAMMQGLMNSPGHKANILREAFDYVGIGIELGYYTQGGQTYHVLMATQNFGATSENVLLDWATGTRGADRIAGTGADDLIRGGGGGDQIRGGAGKDVLEGQRGNDRLMGGGGNDELKGGLGRDVLLGGAGRDAASGGGGADTAKGGLGADVLRGGAGADRLFGQGGNDRIFGQGGNDRLDGGKGRDILNGGVGQDTFVFRDGYGKDKIIGFNRGQDRIELDDALWSGTLNKAQVVDTFARVTDTGVLFDFDGTDDLLLRGLSSTDGLESRIDLI